MSNLSKEISSYIVETFFSGSREKFDLETPLLSSGVIDSISALELVEFLENTYQIEFKPHEVDRDNLDTVSKITQFVLLKKS